MHGTISRLDPSPTQQVGVHKVSGSYVAKNRLTPHQRVFLAKAFYEGRLDISGLTRAQIAKLFRISPTALYAACRAPEHTLVHAWDEASPDTRTEFVAIVGKEEVWAAIAATLD